LSGVTILSVIYGESCFCSYSCLNPAGPTAEEIYFSGRGPKNQISSAIATPSRIFHLFLRGADDLKRNFAQILLLFVSGDDLSSCNPNLFKLNNLV